MSSDINELGCVISFAQENEANCTPKNKAIRLHVKLTSCFSR